MLTLSGSPVNVIIQEASVQAGAGGFGYLEFALIGVPLVIATVVVCALLGQRLLYKGVADPACADRHGDDDQGRPISANSGSPNPPAPACTDASWTMTLTGLPDSVGDAPALQANASGTRIRDGRIRARRATATVTGSSAAAAPLTVITALTTAARPVTVSRMRV